MRIPDRWFGVPRPVSDPALRLFCFPFAGGGASTYRTWPDHLPPEVELCAIQLPGREGRFGEASYDRLTDITRDLRAAIVPHTDLPYAFFGHSMGALIAFTLAKELRRAGSAGPRLLMVSGRRAPQRPHPDPTIHTLPDDEFLEKVREFNGTPEAVLEDAELLELLIPILRADFTVCETFEYAAEGPVTCPIVSFGGIEDPDVSREDIEAWSAMTTGGHSVKMFRGGHFYFLDQTDLLLHEIGRHLDRCRATLVDR